jgi:ABC transport system ATP-binding/permease protein
MSPTHFGSSEQESTLTGPPVSGLASAGSAAVAPPETPEAIALPDLLVRTQRAEYQLRPGTTYRVGRDPDSDIVLTDQRVSWSHAVLKLDADVWTLEDLGSTNGTFLGMRRIDRIEISTECIVRLGNANDGPDLRCIPQTHTVAIRVIRSPGADTGRPSPEPASAPAPPGVAPDARGMPGVDMHPTSLTRLPVKSLRIGRAADNDLVLADLSVSRHHAELRKLPTGSYEIVDLSSHNGTYVNGSEIDNKTLTENDIVGIGRSTFRLKGGELRQYVDDGEIAIAAQELIVKVAGGKVLLDRITFPIPQKCLLGVVGPSGAGKSTLVGALTGIRPADTGTVLYDNRDLYQNYNELRHRIGLVPQENILHTQLTARRALQYSAELRFPADTEPAERGARIDEVLDELGLTKHAETRADRLSGGQLKRVNVAQELLTKPSLLLLDEPTSGLDPGLDKSVMEQLRDLAHDGRTVIVVTHSVANLDTCDRLLVLAPGGRMAFYGPPGEALRYFGLPGWAEVFQAFERNPERDWAGEFAGSPAYAEWVEAQRSKDATVPTWLQPPAAAPPRRQSWLRQTSTLTRRYARVIAADRGYVLFMGLLPIVLGVLVHFVPAKEGLAGAPGTNVSAQQLLQILVTCACLAGTASAVREVVKERPIYIRERAAGLSSGAYLFSKLLILGLISIVQSVVIVFIGLAGRRLPTHGVFLTGLPLVELLIAIAALAIASMCIGLFVSAIVSTSEKAMPFLVMITMAQIILSGGVVPLAGMAGISQVSWIAPSRWGFAAVAETVNLNALTLGHGSSDPLWRPISGNWLRDVGIMIGLAVVFSLLAWIRVRRLGPRRRR